MAKFAFLAIVLAIFSTGIAAQTADTNAVSIVKSSPDSYKYLIPPALTISSGILISNSIGWPFPASDARSFVQHNIGFAHTEVDNYLQFAPAAAVGGLQLSGIKGKNSVSDEFFLYVLSLALQTVIVYPLKEYTGVLRPDGSARNSMPSGHTSTAFAGATFMYLEYRDVSPWYGVAAYTSAAGIGSMRIMRDRHWLSDVLVGAGIGILCTRAAYALYPVIKKKARKHCAGIRVK